MKKTLFLCLLLFSLTILSACSNESVSSSKADSSTSETDKTATNVGEEGFTDAQTANTETTSNEVPTGLNITSPSTTGNFTTGSYWNVIRGVASSDTAAIEINGYRLAKFAAGSQNWNYIATTKMNTLTEGENEYVIKAFDADDNVIDETVFKINYQNGHALANVGTNLNIILFLTLFLTLNLFFYRKKA